MTIALLDANVLWSAPVRDILLRAAERRLFQPLWSTQILEEFSRTLQQHRRDLAPRQFAGLVAQLNIAFPDALIDSYEHLTPAMTNDPEDKHVLAAAIAGHADTLITWNLSQFRPEDCERVGIEVESPDTFLSHLWDVTSNEMSEAVKQQAADLKNPPISVEQLLELLERRVPAFAHRAKASLL